MHRQNYNYIYLSSKNIQLTRYYLYSSDICTTGIIKLSIKPILDVLLTLCMLGNFSFVCCRMLTFQKNSFRNLTVLEGQLPFVGMQKRMCVQFRAARTATCTYLTYGRKMQQHLIAFDCVKYSTTSFNPWFPIGGVPQDPF